jgi:hypothetical protein
MKMVPAMVMAALAIALAGAQPVVPVGAKSPAELAGRTPGKPQRCVGAQSAATFRVADSDPHLLLYGEGKTIFATNVGPNCDFADSGIARPETTASFYCKGDFVRAPGPLNLLPGRHCVLGEFVPYRQ